MLAFGRQLDPKCQTRALWLPGCATALTKIAAEAGPSEVGCHAVLGWAIATVAVDADECDGKWQDSALYSKGRLCLDRGPTVDWSLARAWAAPGPVPAVHRDVPVARARRPARHLQAHVDSVLRSL